VLGGERQSRAVRTSIYEPGSLIETLPLGLEGWFGVQKGKDPGLKGQGLRDSAPGGPVQFEGRRTRRRTKMEATHDHEHDHGGTSGNDLVDGHLAHGSWMGHALPGAFFLAWGTWWMIAITLNYNRSNLARKTYHSKTCFPLHCKWGFQGIEKLEARLKAILPAIGMFAEVYFHPKDIYFRSLFGPDGNIASENVNNWQHFTMYLFFSLSGLLDLFGEKLSLPPTFNQSFLALSFWIEAVLFLFHLKMQFGLMSTIHFLLVMAIIGCAIGCTWESIHPTSINASSLRAIATVLQGTWFYQTANVLYGTNKWSLDVMANDMILSVVWCWHLAACCLLMGVFFLVTRLKVVQDCIDTEGKPSRVSMNHPMSEVELQGLISAQ